MNRRHRVRDCDGREGGASTEGAIANRSHSVRDGDGREGGAFREGIKANCRHSVRDCDGREGGTSREGVIANRRHSFCKSHFCEFTIASEALCSGVYCCLGHFGEGESPGVERIFSPVFSVKVESLNYLILIIYEFLHY